MMMIAWFGLVVFFGISTLVGYLMPNLRLYISSLATGMNFPDSLSPFVSITIVPSRSSRLNPMSVQSCCS